MSVNWKLFIASEVKSIDGPKQTSEFLGNHL